MNTSLSILAYRLLKRHFFILNFIGFLLGSLSCYGQTLFSDTLDWQRTPIEVQSSSRSAMWLNGVWKFCPDTSSAKTKDWGLIYVPGAWTIKAYWTDRPGIGLRGASWLSLDATKLNHAIYQRNINIPSDWSKSEVILSLEHICTDAMIWINGQKAGGINWYSGEIDISKWVRFGKTNQIKILVIAEKSAAKVPVFMGTATEQVSYNEPSLAARGITGTVQLYTRPKKTYISDVFLKPSTRKKQIGIEVEFTGISKASTAEMVVEMYDEKGNKEISFSKNISLKATDVQIIYQEWPWANPRIWDVRDPKRYRAHVFVKQKNICSDVYIQEFGFREFWIEGKDFMFNGRKFNLRPSVNSPGNGSDKLTDTGIDALINQGFNFSELWPNNFEERGNLNDWLHFMGRASLKGYLVSGVLTHLSSYIVNSSFSIQWDKPGIAERWQKNMTAFMRKQRNFPSVIMWGTTANFFGHSDDQNPKNIGMRGYATNPSWNERAKVGMQAIEIVKKIDPTRPVFTHHGAYVGDVHTVNFYLNFIPLQEREEWLSHYAEHGQMPFCGVEFGTPLANNFLRGRNGFGPSVNTEPFMSEYSAMYMGSKAYSVESKAYRQEILDRFVGKDLYDAWHGSKIMETTPAFQYIQKLFITNTWRSWRVYGISGGMIPWASGYNVYSTPLGKQKKNMPQPKPGYKDIYHPLVSLANQNPWQAPYAQIQPAGLALQQNNSQTLAYIAGPTNAFTAKDHHFVSNAKISKQIAIISDTSAPVSYKWSCQLLLPNVAGKIIAQKTGMVVPGMPLLDSFSILAPSHNQTMPLNAKFVMNATIGAQTHSDTFNFSVYAKPTNQIKFPSIALIDQIGHTEALLKSQNIPFQKWKNQKDIEILIIGKQALNPKTLSQIQTHLGQGGKVLLMSQPKKMLDILGFRYSNFQSRLVFGMPNTPKALLNGLSDQALTNWNGQSSLLEPYPDVKLLPSQGDYPYYGWHWGNRHTVSSIAIEKPHRSGWTPLLETEFDLAYSPLMQLNYKKGLLVFSALDLEDHAGQDPAAQKLFFNLLDYIQKAKIIVSRPTFYIGNATGVKVLKQMGVMVNNWPNKKILPAPNSLLIIGKKHQISDQLLSKYVQQGGQLLVWATDADKAVLGASQSAPLPVEIFQESHIANWPELLGISISDLRTRTHTAHIRKWKGVGQISADGLIAKLKLAKGTVIFTSIDAESLPTDTLTYLRTTRWRHTRALSQLLTNLGARFNNDEQIFVPLKENTNTNEVSLDGAGWWAAPTGLYPGILRADQKPKDKGISQAAQTSIAAGLADSSSLQKVIMPNSLENFGPEWKDKDGEIVQKKMVILTDNMRGKDLDLNLDVIDDFDQVYWNGKLIGQTDDKNKEPWSFRRVYKIPASLSGAAKNVLAVRIFDNFGGGGFTSNRPRAVLLPNVGLVWNLGYYHPDYRTDFEMGDEPYRYFRW